MLRRLVVVSSLALLGSFPCAESVARLTSPEPPKPGAKKVYDESADAEKDVAAALERAKRDHKRVLIQWGANWCGWCIKLHRTFESEPEIAKTLNYEYEVVYADLGSTDKWPELRKRLGVDFKDAGIPFLTILDDTGKPLVQQATGPLEVDDRHDPAKVLAFLKEHAAKPLDAVTVLDTALAAAKKDDKVVFVHFGAPWCGWCHKLDDWLASADIAPRIAERAVEVKIDVDRMTHGEDVMKRFRSSDSGGIPWFAFVDGSGQSIATSDATGKNIGYPAAESEIAAFGTMLEKAGYSAETIASLRQSLTTAAQESKRSSGK